jgi:hypothetical protein
MRESGKAKANTKEKVQGNQNRFKTHGASPLLRCSNILGEANPLCQLLLKINPSIKNDIT